MFGLMIPLARLPSMAVEYAREGIRLARKAERVFRKDDRKAFRIHLAAARRLDLAAWHLREYVKAFDVGKEELESEERDA